ncbi:PAS domain S-box protein [Arenibacter aquaticus]|uniref:histidine kinase n=2 Tax=Arenibacter aquaticus TaxID=2489054 RepID=A0A3S0C6X2_9FLAO|nr:PAS domain S-box protein [Arenibacter aquaticus]
MYSCSNNENEFRSELVVKLSWIWIIVNTLVMVGGIIIYAPASVFRWVSIILTVSGIGLLTLGLNRFGHTKIAAYVLPCCMFLHITNLAYTGGGTILPGIANYIPIVLTTGFLLGRQKGIIMAVLCIAVTFGLALLEANGNLPEVQFVRSPIGRGVALVLPISLAAAIQYFATHHLSTSLVALQNEIQKREVAEKIKDQSVYDLGERVKELKVLYNASHILQNLDVTSDQLFQELVEVIPMGWQYPEITSARICVDNKEYVTPNYMPSNNALFVEMKTIKESKVSIEVVYSQSKSDKHKIPFLKEEHNLLNTLVEMLKVNLEHREKRAELKDYKYALDVAASISITDIDGCFSFVNENFCRASKYRSDDLEGEHYSIIMSGLHPPDYFLDLKVAMQEGKPFRGEFCNKAKDGSLYWVDTFVVPFFDDNGNIYQYLSIHHDITIRKEGETKIKESEQLLRKITSQVPANTYMFEIDEKGSTKVLFMNSGKDILNYDSDIEQALRHPEMFRGLLHDDDKTKFNNAMKEAYLTEALISVQYRVVVNEQVRWRWMQAIPEKDKNGKIVWYGATGDITPLIDYITFIEQILYDISHVMRRPVTTMMSLTSLIIDTDLSEKEIKEFSRKLYGVSEELEKFTRELSHVYYQKRQNSKFDVDIDLLIDKRGNLFG